MRTFLRVVAVSGTLAAASATLAQPEYRIIDLTEIANLIGVVQSQADAVNNDGVIIGWEAMDLAINKPLCRPGWGLSDSLTGFSRSEAVSSQLMRRSAIPAI